MAETVLTALLALWLASAALGLVGTAVFAWQTRRFARIARGFVPPDPAPAAIIVPLKGAPPYAASCLAAMLAQDYPRYRLIAVVESEHDPAHRLMRDITSRDGGGRITLVVAGRAERRGQKVHNLLAGLAALEPGDTLVCFADADALWAPDTLSTLLRELSVWTDPLLLSGYRWMFPTGGQAGAVWAAAASLPVAAAAKAPSWDLAWGGTMAAKRSTLERIDLPALWDRSLSDDVPLSGALRRQGFVKLMPNLVVPSPADFSIGDALNFARRQYAMLRVYAPRHWLFSLLVYGVFFAGFGASVAALTMPVAAYITVVALAAWGLAAIRGLAHAALVWRLLPRAVARRMGWVCALDTLLPFVPAALHAYGLLSSIRPRRIDWAGIIYTLDGKKVVRVER